MDLALGVGLLLVGAAYCVSALVVMAWHRGRVDPYDPPMPHDEDMLVVDDDATFQYTVTLGEDGYHRRTVVRKRYGPH